MLDLRGLLMLKSRIKDCSKINKNIKLLYRLQYLEATSAHVDVNKVGQAEQHGVGIGGWSLHSCTVVLIPLWKWMSHLQATQMHTDTAKAMKL